MFEAHREDEFINDSAVIFWEKPFPRFLFEADRQWVVRPRGKGAAGIARLHCYHVVALKSSTLGSLNLDLPDEDHEHCDDKLTVSDGGPRVVSENLGPYQKQKLSLRDGDQNICNGHGELLKDNLLNAFSMGLIEAKTWSNMINEKITKVVPKTPVMTPPGEPEKINEWELMEGLEDEVSPFRSPNHVRSFSFEVIRSLARAPCDLPKSRFRENDSISPKPACSGGIVTEFDPGIIASFGK